MADAPTVVHPVSEHPIPFDQTEVDSVWQNHDATDQDPPHIDEAHEEYTRTITQHDDWHVFRVTPPFGRGENVYVWNTSLGEGFRLTDDEGSWHELVNLFAAIVDAEGDCRTADLDSSLLPSGCYSQNCLDCGDSWVIG